MWIKMDIDLAEKPEVIRLSNLIQIDRFSVVGRLHRFWSWWNKHSETGHACGVTKVFLDELVSVTGFSDALEKVGWLKDGKEGLSLPNFDRHNSHSAKERALATERKRLSRSSSMVPQKQSQICHGDSVTELRPEKRREEKMFKTPIIPNRDVEEIYQAYPRKTAKASAEKAISKALLLIPKEQLLPIVKRYAAARSTEDPKYTPHPASWFNAQRWTDDPETWTTTPKPKTPKVDDCPPYVPGTRYQ